MQPQAIPPECFALLDDSSAQQGSPRTRLYTDLAGVLACHSTAELNAMLAALQRELAAGLHAVGLFEYELGARMQGVLPDDPAVQPLARILLFSTCRTLTPDETEQWLNERDDGVPAGVAGIEASVDEAAFSDAIGRIRDWIEAGDTYQVNYTYRLHFDAYGMPLALYRRLRARQPVPYGALIALPEGGAVLSLSPELFVRHVRGQLLARPMKGTAPASGDPEEDARRAAELAADEKNRAENLMIVDLLRNDLGRVARFGTVRVPRLFQVDRFSSVLQMTSTVEAQAQAGVSLADVFSALYPCGSITGAPKHRTMQIIDELETEARGLYTGALGWFDAPPHGQALPEFCLSVPIRTLVLKEEQGGLRRGMLGVGAGIVHDSDAHAEFAECALKARFLTGLANQFSLIETMHATVEGCRHLDRHIGRLCASARYFSFSFDEAAVRSAVREACARLRPAQSARMRLALDCEGRLDLQIAPLAPLPQPVNVLLAPEPVRSDDLFLRHKTSIRARYDAAWREAEKQGAFDMLFFNERGELTEGARSNVFVRLEGRWFTPPLRAGLLPGVMRSVILDDPHWNAEERSIPLEDLSRAEEVMVCNALRGPLQARVIGQTGD